MKIKSLYVLILGLVFQNIMADSFPNITILKIATDDRSGGGGLYFFSANGLPAACSDGKMWADASQGQTVQGKQSLLSVVLTAKTTGSTVEAYYTVTNINSVSYCYVWQIIMN